MAAIVHCSIISSCQSAATSEIVKHFWSCTHVRSAITSIATFTFLPFDIFKKFFESVNSKITAGDTKTDIHDGQTTRQTYTGRQTERRQLYIGASRNKTTCSLSNLRHRTDLLGNLSKVVDEADSRGSLERVVDCIDVNVAFIEEMMEHVDGFHSGWTLLLVAEDEVDPLV